MTRSSVKLRNTSSPLPLLEETAVIIPTFNAAHHWEQLHAALEAHRLEHKQVLIVDSSSKDGTALLAHRAGYRVKRIPQHSFQHGSTRQMAACMMPWAKILIYLTQDAVLNGAWTLQKLLSSFDDPTVGAAYGRQVARSEADEIERHSRLFNYPEQSEIRDLRSRESLGFKAAFFSNSFAAYRRVALEEVGGFPEDTIVSEEVTVAARMLIAGWKIAYRADATAIHSHHMTLRREFSRFFDIGVHHGRSQWLLEQFGGAGGEGRAFVHSQMRFLLQNRPSLIPIALVRDINKWFGYHLGLYESWLPFGLKRVLSGQDNFWHQEQLRQRRSGNSVEEIGLLARHTTKRT